MILIIVSFDSVSIDVIDFLIKFKLHAYVLSPRQLIKRRRESLRKKSRREKETLN